VKLGDFSEWKGQQADDLLALPVQPDVPRDHLDYVEAVLHLLLGIPCRHARD